MITPVEDAAGGEADKTLDVLWQKEKNRNLRKRLAKMINIL
jgi:hypothetical protein